MTGAWACPQSRVSGGPLGVASGAMLGVDGSVQQVFEVGGVAQLDLDQPAGTIGGSLLTSSGESSSASLMATTPPLAGAYIRLRRP